MRNISIFVGKVLQKHIGQLHKQIKLILLPLAITVACTLSAFSASANVNVLIVGSTGDTTNSGYVSGNSKAFDPSSIRTHLQNILQGASLGSVNVEVENRGSPYGLAAWFHYPTPAGVETTTRWPKLRGESGTDWDYVIVIGDPYTMEYMPGLYAHGAAMVAQEVAKGGAETVLLMPWPASTSSSTVAHYKEVVYRAGRSGPYKVAPAALAWQAAGSPTGATHPLSTNGAFIAAAAIYSTIWNQSASASTYVYNDALADLTHTTVTTNNNNANQYTGDISFQNPFLMLGDKRRDVHFSEKGTSTEQDFKGSVVAAMNRARVTFNHGSYSDKYTSNTPEDDAKGWPVANPMPIAWNHGRKFSEVAKEYVTNPSYWQLGMGFKYQYNTWANTAEQANDTHLGQILSQDIDLADYMRAANNMGAGQHSSARIIPWRLIWGQIHHYDGTLNPLRDGSGPHMNHDLHKAVGTYMYTMYSGRCPLDPEPTTMTTTWMAQKFGYEMAWRAGRCQTRAPGFKVVPSAATKKTINAGTTEIMTVQFIFKPLSNVTVNITSSDPSVASVSPSQLIFTPTNYKNPQSVTVSVLPNISADQAFNVIYNTVSNDEACNKVSDSWEYNAIASTLPIVSWTTPSQTSTNESGSMLVTAQLSKTSGVDVTIPFTVSGTASGTDRTVSASPLIIPAGSLSAQVTINITPDTIDEPDETVILTMGAVTGANKGATYVHTATIKDDDNPVPTVSVVATDNAATEAVGNNGEFTFTLSSMSASPTTVNFTVGGSATSGSDYTSIGTTIIIPANQLSTTVAVAPLEDNIYENNETVILTLASGTGYSVGSPNSGTVTITDNDSAPAATIAATDASATEAAGDNGVFTISLSRASSSATTVNFTVSGSATSGADYTSIGTSVSIPAGQLTATKTVTPSEDDIYENNETVIVTLVAGTGYSVGSPNSGTVTITDNDSAPVATIAATDATATEAVGNTGVFTITLSRASSSATTVNFTVSGSATSGVDYTSIGTSVSIPAGQLNATKTVTPIEDDIYENNETVIATLATGTGYSVGSPNNATINITDNDSAPVATIAASDATAAEAVGNTGEFTMTLSRKSSSATTVNFTVSGSATSGADFTSIGTSVIIPANQLSATVSVATIEDDIYENNETVIATLASGTGYSVGSPNAATVTITDNDSAPAATITASDATATEAAGNSGEFTMTLSRKSSSATTVNFTVSGSATSGADFTSIGTSVIIPANQLSATVSVATIEDDIYENNETVIATLASGTGYSVGSPNDATVTITDNDSAPVVTIVATDPDASEAPITTGTFTISLSRKSSVTTAVNLSVSGTATNGTDYNLLGTTINIPADTTQGTITVTPIADGNPESDETVIVTLQSGTGYSVGSPSGGTVTITDSISEPVVTISATDASATEAPGNNGEFTITLSKTSASSTTVNFTVSGSASIGNDYTSIGTSVTIPAGQLTATKLVVPLEDNVYENNETVIVTLASGTGYAISSPNSATVTITDNDSSPIVTIAATDSTASESPITTGTFTITLSRLSSTTTTVKYTVSGTAASGTDYVAIGTSKNIPAGSTQATITVTPIADAITETDETVVVTLIAGTGYSVGSPTNATVTISEVGTNTVTNNNVGGNELRKCGLGSGLSAFSLLLLISASCALMRQRKLKSDN